MENIQNRGPEGPDRFDHVENLLSRYPSISEAEVRDLKRWFNKEASAFDVASLASIESIHSRYAAFRADHINGFTARDYLVAAVVVAVGGGLIFLMM